MAVFPSKKRSEYEQQALLMLLENIPRNGLATGDYKPPKVQGMKSKGKMKPKMKRVP